MTIAAKVLLPFLLKISDICCFRDATLSPYNCS